MGGRCKVHEQEQICHVCPQDWVAVCVLLFECVMLHMISDIFSIYEVHCTLDHFLQWIQQISEDATASG